MYLVPVQSSVLVIDNCVVILAFLKLFGRFLNESTYSILCCSISIKEIGKPPIKERKIQAEL